MGEVEDLLDALVGDTVVDRAALAARLDEAAPAEAARWFDTLGCGMPKRSTSSPTLN